MIRIGLVGAGKRMQQMNLPILKQLSSRVKVVGITTRRGKVDTSSIGLNNIPVYDSLDKMYEETEPDLVIISIPYTQAFEVLKKVIPKKVPILVETPISFDLTQTNIIRQMTQHYDCLLGVIEDWLYLPMECFKKRIIKKGILGDIMVVENDYRTYDYHGIAQIKGYLPKNVFPVSVKQEQSAYRVEEKIDHWKITTAKFNNGALFINKYSSLYKKVDFRIRKELRIYGTKGTIMSGCLLDSHCLISVLDEQGKSQDLKVVKEYAKSNIKNISTTLHTGEKIEWENPFVSMDLTEAQNGIMYNFEKMFQNIEKKQKTVLYGSNDFFNDLKTFHGINQ